jgi:hypothetical protein
MELHHMSLTSLMQHYRNHINKKHSHTKNVQMASAPFNDDPFNNDPFNRPQNNQPPRPTQEDKQILGMALSVFIAILVLAFITWVVAIVLLVKNWNSLPDWAKVLGVLGVIPAVPMGSIVTIIVVLIGRQQGPSQK